MLTTLAAALSLASSLAIDVPYLPQTDALCGGAAAAMVFRYWGDAHADVQEFAPLVDRRAGGIANDVLTDAVRTRGWRAGRIDGSLDALAAHVHDGQPVIVLLPDRGDRYRHHYVVVTGVSADAIVVHDPAWGPSRTIRAPDFERAWQAAGFWSLLILPPAVSTGQASPAPEAPAAAVVVDACDARLNRAMDEIRERGLNHADALLGEVRAQCPNAAGPLRELSGVRFAQRRWSDAAALARDALRRDPNDAYALDVLGSSLFMQDDGVGALRAWNQIGKPRVNRVRIEGLHHTRYQTVAEVMAIQPNMLLTAELFDRARRRLSELPDHATTRLAVRPEADGFATVDVVVVELAAVPHGVVEWAGAAARTAANREVSVSVPGVRGEGDVWSAGWRWWNNRPGVSVGFAAPLVRGLPGVWQFEGVVPSDTHGARASRIVESRTHGGLTMSDWLPGRVRYALTMASDSWTGGRKAASIGGALEHVAVRDVRSVAIRRRTQWPPVTGGSAFGSVGARACRAVVDGHSTLALRAGGSVVERVSDAAPPALWPGAGDGHVRAQVLRAHPLLHDGVVDLTGSAASRPRAYVRERGSAAVAGAAVAGSSRGRRLRRRRARDTAGRRRKRAGAGIWAPACASRFPARPACCASTLRHGLRDFGANALTFGWLF